MEIANTPHMDAMSREGVLGLARTVPSEMEPSSACACMSVFGYDPRLYYRGRSAIEAKSLGISTRLGDALFRCNLVTVIDEKMASYSAGHISSEEAKELVEELNRNLGDENICFFPGTSYRNICRITGGENTLNANCTPPHDIPNKPISEFLPGGPGSELLRELMFRSRNVLTEHPVNKQRESRGDMVANMIWLFWGSGRIPDMPSFKDVFGLTAAMITGVDLLRGLSIMMGIEILDIAGVTDGPDNDYAAQANGAIRALDTHDLVAVHIEAPDEAGHAGSIKGKIEAIEKIDHGVISRLRIWNPGNLCMLIMPDHPTPIELRTHTDDPAPFLLWGPGFETTGAQAFTEAEAKKTGVYFENGHEIMGSLVKIT